MVGRVSGHVYPDGTQVDRSYTARGQLATASLNEAVLDTRTYDNGGRLASSVYRNGISATRVYNDDNTLAEIDHSGSIGDFTYQWDANKNKTSELITGVMASHTLDEAVYDQEDRLEEADYANKSQAWDLSLVGDWNRYTSDGATQDRVHGPTHELLSVSQNAGAAQALAHDAKGNQTLLPPVLGRQTAMVMKWDFENKLTSADTDNDGVDDVTYQWDALQRRVRRDHGGRSAVYVQNGRQTVAEYPAGRPASVGGYRYVWGAYIDEPIARLNSVNGGLIYYHQNQQYSVIALSSSSGVTIERYAYDAYGTPTVTRGNGAALERSFYGNRHTYTGREYDDALGLYHYRARMYDSLAGRFCSRDPIGFKGSRDMLYEYVEGQPLFTTDPMGLWAVTTAACGGCAACIGPAIWYCGSDPECWRITWSLLPTLHKWACGAACGGCALIVGKKIVVAAPVVLAKLRPRPPRRRPRKRCKPKCTAAYKLAKNAEIHAVCDQPRKCTLGRSACDYSLSPEEMLARSAISQRCADIRQGFSNKCFKGTDPAFRDHKLQENQARRASRKCWECAASHPGASGQGLP